jgi:hypothetical protein
MKLLNKTVITAEKIKKDNNFQKIPVKALCFDIRKEFFTGVTWLMDEYVLIRSTENTVEVVSNGVLLTFEIIKDPKHFF